MSTNHDPSNLTIDELFQQLLDGELEDVDVFLSRLDDDQKIKHAADIQLVHSMLLHLSDRASGKNEQRVVAAMQRLQAESASTQNTAVVGRIGRFVSSPLFRWAAAACIVFAVIFTTANIGTTANASLDRMIQAAAINADRTYLITHDIGDGPPPSPFNAQGNDSNNTKSGESWSKDRATNGDGRSKMQWPPRKPSGDGNDDKWKKIREYWEAKKNSQRRDDQNSDKADDKNRDKNNDNVKSDSSDDTDRDRERKQWDDKRRADRDSRDDRNDRDGRDGKNENWGDRSRDGSRTSSSKGGDYRSSHGRRPTFNFGPATLYVRGENQFVLKRPMPNGELIVGSNGKQSWIVGPTGPVYISDDPRTLCAGPQGDLGLPFLNISEGLDQLKERYNIQKVADAPLPPKATPDGQTNVSTAPVDGRLYHRLDGTKHASVPGPNEVSIWADPVTNIVRKVILNDFGSRHRYGFHPRRIVFDLESTDKLPSDFFEHTAHHEADREVKTRQPRSHHDRRR